MAVNRMPDYLTIPEVAQLVRLGERTVYDMCRLGRLPGVAKVGGKWRVERARLLAWLDAGGEQPVGQPAVAVAGMGA